MASEDRPAISVEAPTEESKRLWKIAAELARGGRMRTPPRPGGDLGYRFDVDGAVVEILGPDGVRADPRTLGNHTAFKVAGGTQALNRTEVVAVSVEGEPSVPMRRPSLLGAILIKARAVAKKRKGKFDSDRQDLILLLSLVDDPRALAAAGDLRKTEKSWLRNVENKVGFADPTLSMIFSPEALARASQAFRLLVG